MSALSRPARRAAETDAPRRIDRLTDRHIATLTMPRYPRISAPVTSVPDGTHPLFRGDASCAEPPTRRPYRSIPTPTRRGA